MTETESRPRNRALVASFLFTDLVGYSKGSAAEQYAEKAALSEILRGTLAALDKDDYRIKDTGDGALIAFLSNPEHALYAALAITTGFARTASVAGFPSSTLRTGLHIGAVKEAIDLEARPNFVGDGINAAKRIMDFAAPGQITSSRAYFEAISWLDAAYAAMFQHLGASDDKHGRAHDLYAILPDAAVLERLRADLAPMPRDIDERKTNATAAVATTQTRRAGDSPAHARGTRATRWMLPIAALIAVGAAAAFLVIARAPAPLAVTARPASADSAAAPSSAAAGAAASSERLSAPAAETPPTSTPVASTPVPSTSEVSSPATDTRNAEKISPPPARRSAAVVPAMQSAELPDARRKSTEPPGAAAATGVPKGQGSERCRRMLEKAALGEPLSQEENRELATTCR